SGPRDPARGAPGSDGSRRAPPCPRPRAPCTSRTGPRPSSRARPTWSPRASARSCRLLFGLFFAQHELPQLLRELRQRLGGELERAATLAGHDVLLPPLRVGLGVVLAGVAAAALLAHEGRARAGLRDREHGPQI